MLLHDIGGTGAGLAIALYEPDRPHNFGTLLRLAACLGLPLELIEPAGFPLDDRRIREAALDYGGTAQWRRHASFAAFEAWRLAERRRLVLLSTRATGPYHRATYGRDDILMLGRESAGVPAAVHDKADLCVRVPMVPGRRSLNVAMAAALVLGEALRQTGGLDRLAGGAA